MASKGKGIASYGKRKQRDNDDNGADKKRRDRSVLQFFEDAAVDDDAPDSDSDDSFFDEDFLDELMAKVKKEPGREEDDHHRVPFFPKEEELSGDELEKMLEERYRGSRYVKYAEDDNESRRSTDKDYQLPPGEPAIWKVKCKVGREKNTVFCLMQKFVDLKALGTKLHIISAFAAEHIKGFVFVEAEKQSDVVMACNQLADVYFTLVTQVPSDEVAKLLAVRKRHSEVKEGTWARVKNGIYRGDLAQVVAVNNERKRATVKLIPRIDLQALTEKYGVGGRLKRAKGSVPAARLISSTDLEEFRPLIQYRRDRDTGQMFEFLDSLMLKDGFLYKKISIESLSFWGVNPSQDELEKFTIPSNDGTDNVEWLSQLYGEQKKNSFVKAGKGGDKGGGKGEGSSGSQEQSSFEVHDLVHFGKREFGMVIGLDKDESYKILKEGSDGPVTLNMGQKDLKFVPLEKKFTALDHRMKTISINDTVKILDGPAKDRQGIVKQIYRGIIFLYDENDLENAYFCSKSQSSQKVKHSDFACHGKDEGGPSSFEEAPSSPKSPLSPKKPWQARDNFEDRADKEGMFSVGQSLRIRIGPLKGYMCRVLAIRFSDVTVKLDSQQKVFTVKREHLSEVRGKSSTSLTRDDPESSSPFKPFDLLGSEGNANEWLHQASGSADGGGWNVGGSSTERSAWPAFPSVASLQVGTTATDVPSSVTNDDSKEDNAWLSKAAVGNNSSQAGGWGSSSGGWGKSKEPVADQGSSWKAAGESSLCLEKADTIATNNWGSSSGGWGKAKDSGGDLGESWNAGGFSLSQEKTDTIAKNNWNSNSGGWEKAKEPGGGQGGSWNAGASGCGIQKIAAGDSWGEKKNSSDTQGWGSSVGASQSEALTSAETRIGWGQSQGEKASGGTWAKAKASEDKEDPWGKVVDKQGAKDGSAKQIGWGSSTNKPSDGNGWGTSSGGMRNSQEENSEAGWKAPGGWKSSEDGGNSSWGGSGGNNSWGKSKNFENDGFSRGQGSSGRGRGRDQFGRGRGRGRGRSFDKGDDYQGWNKSNEADKDGGGPGGWSSERSSPQAGWNSASFGSSSWGQKDDTQTGGSDDTWGKAANTGNKNLGASKGWKNNSTSTQSWGGQGNSGQTSEANATDGWKKDTTTSGGWSKGEDMGQGKSWGKDFGSEGGESWSKSSGNNSWTCDNDQGQGFGGRRGGRGFRGGRGESGRGFRGGRDDFGRGGGGRSFGRGGRNGGEGGSFNNRNNGGSWSKGRWGTDGAGEDRSWKKPSEGGSSWGGGTDGGGDAKDWGKPSEDSSWGVKSSGVGGSWVAGGGGSDNKVGGDGNIRSKGWSSVGSSSWGGGGDGNNKMSGDSSDGSKGWNSGGNSRGGRGSSGGGFVGGSGSWGGGSDKKTGIDENNGSKGWNSGCSSWGGGGSNGGSGSWGGGSDKKTGIDENNGSKGWNSGGRSWGGGGSNGGDSRGDGGNGGGFWGDNNRAGGGGSSWGSGQGGGSSWGKSSSGQSSDAGGGWGK